MVSILMPNLNLVFIFTSLDFYHPVLLVIHSKITSALHQTSMELVTYKNKE